MRVVITGATGFIGKALCQVLHKDYEIVALSRNAEKANESLGQRAKAVQWGVKTYADWRSEIDGAKAIINLAGESIASGRWSASKKQRILHSRLDAIECLAEAIRQARIKPRVVVQASAIGYYGPRQNEPLDEDSPAGTGFLPIVCRSIENAAKEFEYPGVRCVIVRSGIVLGRQGGALARLAKPFRFYLGGHPGSGNQWFSWISLDDEVAAITWLLENENLYGTFNLTAPEPVTMKDFCKILGKVLSRPAWLPVPGSIVRLALGEMADEMLLSGQRVLPRRLLDAGFQFKHPYIEDALSAILSSRR